MTLKAEVAVTGVGSVGIATAYYLAQRYGVTNVVILDPRAPMSCTSAQSGENYRNWWPDETMRAFTDHSITLLEEIARASNNRINMRRRGYALATRDPNPTTLIDELYHSYGRDSGQVRLHRSVAAPEYLVPAEADWEKVPGGVDVLLDTNLIRRTFPGFAPDISAVLHVRRAGDISGQQLGQYMLEVIQAQGVRVIPHAVVSASQDADGFVLRLDDGAELCARKVVNAAGPWLGKVAALLGESFDLRNVYQQKIAFEDTEGAISRTAPFSIDLDRQGIAWEEDEREELARDPNTEHLLQELPGGIHCRPDGAESGTWIKLGWAFNDTAGDPSEAEPIDDNFPDIVIRNASRLNPALSRYIGRLPRRMHHYGGYYTMTPENLPLIGPAGQPGSYICGALSGYGTMGACAAGELCAGWVTGAPLPAYAKAMSPMRYQDPELMQELTAKENLGLL
jgi:glycine/D-amino acid oxidase-like deaminating enzyme